MKGLGRLLARLGLVLLAISGFVVLGVAMGTHDEHAVLGQCDTDLERAERLAGQLAVVTAQAERALAAAEEMQRERDLLAHAFVEHYRDEHRDAAPEFSW
jgi:hypothetical protein